MDVFHRDAWLSDVLEIPSFRVGALPAGAGTDELSAAMAGHAPRGRAFYFAKIDSADVAGVEKFVRSGFNVTDVSVTFVHRGHDPVVTLEGAAVEVASSDDADEVADLSGRCFTFSRFHADHRLGLKRGNAVKREWARNSCKGRAPVVYVIREKGRIAGFLAVMKREGHKGTEAAIDLIGVDVNHQGKGFGRLLTHRFIRDWAKRVSRLVVGTQIANVPALRLYETLGFSVCDTAYVLHAHRIQGEVLA